MKPKTENIPEIEVTPAMVEAGATVVFDLREEATAWELSEAIYRAMEQARLNAYGDPRTSAPSQNHLR